MCIMFYFKELKSDFSQDILKASSVQTFIVSKISLGTIVSLLCNSTKLKCLQKYLKSQSQYSDNLTGSNKINSFTQLY